MFIFLNFSCLLYIYIYIIINLYIYMFTSMFAPMSLFVPFSPFKSIILPHSSYWTGKIKTPHLNLWVALKTKQPITFHSVCISVPLHPPPLFSPFLSPLLFSHLLSATCPFLTVTCVSTCLPLISAFTLQKPSHILKFEESSFQTSRCRQLPHAEHYTYRCESSLYPRLVSA